MLKKTIECKKLFTTEDTGNTEEREKTNNKNILPPEKTGKTPNTEKKNKKIFIRRPKHCIPNGVGATAMSVN